MSITGANAAKRIVILGGGITGLSYLHYLRVFASAMNKEHLLGRIVLVEANDHLGGALKSKVYDDGTVHELGIRLIRTYGIKSKTTMSLVEHVGLDKEVIALKANNTKGRQVLTERNQIEDLPESMFKLFRKLPGMNKRIGQILWRDMYNKPKMDLSKYPDQDPSLYDFVSYRFGSDVADAILDPVIRGVNAGDCRNLSTRALVSDILDKEQAYGSVMKSVTKPPIKVTPHDELYAGDVLNSKFIKRVEKERILSYTFSQGVSILPQRLANTLINDNPGDKVNIYNQTKAIAINFENEEQESECSVIVETTDGDRVKIDADHVVSSIASVDFVKLFKATLPSNRRTIWEDIVDVPHNPIGQVCIEYHDRLLKNRQDLRTSAGLLLHSKSDSRTLSISYDSNIFPDPDPDTFKINVMIGGDWFNSVLGTSDVNSISPAQLEEIALTDLRKILKIDSEPLRISTQMWKTGIAQYRPGHKERIDRTRANVKRLGIPLTLIGQSYDGIAVNDIIFGARMAAYNFVKDLCDI